PRAFVGLFVGIDLIFNGWSWVMLALAVRAPAPAAQGVGAPFAKLLPVRTRPIPLLQRIGWPTTNEGRMFERTKFLSLIILLAGALLGYLAAAGNPRLSRWANAAEQDTKAPAQPATPAPGSPGATTTIDGRYLPNQPGKFGGEINLNAKDSK